MLFQLVSCLAYTFEIISQPRAEFVRKTSVTCWGMFFEDKRENSSPGIHYNICIVCIPHDASPVDPYKFFEKLGLVKVFHLPGRNIFVLPFGSTTEFPVAIDQIMITERRFMYSRRYYVSFACRSNMIY